MNDQTDSQLLRAYAERRSEPAFAELVRRHVDFVYSAARRMVCDSHLAQDVTQAVFVALAKNASQLTDRLVLSGWLHRTAQNIAAQTVRTDVRRRAREQEAAAMNELLATEPDIVWEHIAPHLDDALGELSESDRDALLLRYFERKSAREMAQTLGISDAAAQKRVNRAVERLREFFAKRGITVGASGLVVVISANAVQAAPVGLAVTISTATFLAGTSIFTTAAVTVGKAIAMTTLQKTLIAAAIAVAVGIGIYEAREASTTRTEAQILKQQQALMARQLEQMTRERDDATRQVAALRDDNERLNRNTAELLRLRGEAGVLRQQKRELEQALAVDNSRRSGPMSNLATQPARFQPFQLQLVVDEPAENTDVMTNYDGGAIYHVQKGPLLDHTSLSSATLSTNALGAPQIDIEFSPTGAEQFAQITKTNINKRLAIVLDGGLYSVPVIRSEISGGKAQISGSFTEEEAKGLAAKINDAIGSQ